MPPQTSHTVEMPIARAGLVATPSPNLEVLSRLAEDAAGNAAGTFVAQGTDTENQAVAPTNTNQINGLVGLGVVMYDASKEPARTAAAIAADNEYDVEQSLPVVHNGPIWVLCDDNAVIVAGTQAFVRHVAGGGEKLGAFRHDVDAGDATALPNAVFRSAHTDIDLQGGFTQRIAKLELNMPVAP